jgi:type IV pilus assembly protein PilX
MLNAQLLHGRHLRQRQQGVVLLVALIVLVIMALATAALMRSVSSTSAVAGNLAFQQAATTSADRGVEAAVAWLENNHGQSSSATADACSAGSTVLACDQSGRGYLATRSDPGSTQTWADLWTRLVAAGSTPVSQATDAAGNTTAYLIQRMCSAAGDASTDNGCAIQPTSTECGQSHNVNSQSTSCTSQVYYRITVRTTGPRNTLSFTQAMVAL